MVPLAAAAAVLVAVAAPGLVAKSCPGRRHRPGAPRGSGGSAVPHLGRASCLLHCGPRAVRGRRAQQHERGRLAASQLPRAQNLQIIATGTGQAVATVRLPGYVASISASAGAFFAAVVKDHAATFYEVRRRRAAPRR